MSKASGSPVAGVASPEEAEPHLRAVLESQPVVLTRVGKDGTFLAINDAGLSMLGASSLEQVLGTSLISLVPEDERATCRAFVERAAGGTRGSFEVDLLGLTGTRHTVELHACAHPGAPDGISSVLINLRDVTESRRLEQSLLEAAARQSEQDGAHEAERTRLLADLELARRAQSDQFSADEQLTALERRLAEADEQRTALTAQHAAHVAQLTEALAEQRHRTDEQGALAARLAGAEQQLADLRALYEAAESERQQLLEMAGLLRGEADERQNTLNELTGRLESLDAERQQAADAANALRLDLDERHALVADLTARLELLQAEHQQTSEGNAQLRRDIETRNAFATELASRIEALEAEQLTLKSQSEGGQRELQERYDTDTTALRDALNEAMTEQARLAEALGGGEDALARHSAQIAELERTLAEERAGQARALAEAESLRAAQAAEIEAHTARVSELEAAQAAHVAQLEAAQAAHLAQLDAAQAAHVAELEAAQATHFAELETKHATHVAELEAAHASRVTELEAAQAARLEELETAHVTRLAAIETAHAAQLAEARAAASEAERAAKQALAGEVASRTGAEQALKQLVAAFGRLATEAGQLAGGAAPRSVMTTTKALASRLESELPRRLGDGLDFSMLPSRAGGAAAIEENAVMSAIGAFADSRRVSMLSGTVQVELADVGIDEGAGRARALTPGEYVLVVLTVDGPGAQQGFAPEIFDSSDPRVWREAREEVQMARTAILAAGGQVWLTREGASILIVEFYLPRALDAGTR